MSKEKYTAVDIAEKMGEGYQTVIKRMTSKYADKRWGVREEVLPDGSIKRYVPKELLSLWEDAPDYMGRPVFKKDK